MGKSTLVTQLAERVNISNILQTSIVDQVMSVFFSEDESEEAMKQSNTKCDQNHIRNQIITNFKRKCKLIRNGCNFDVSKCFIDGKPLIIDGSHIDPESFIKSLPASFTKSDPDIYIKSFPESFT